MKTKEKGNSKIIKKCLHKQEIRMNINQREKENVGKRSSNFKQTKRKGLQERYSIIKREKKPGEAVIIRL